MEINLAFKDFDFRNEDQVAVVDRLRRGIFTRFPEAVWERGEDGLIITI